MHDFSTNKPSSCRLDEGRSSLIYNLRDVFAFVNHLDYDKCSVFRSAKSSLQVPDFNDFKISDRYCWSFLSTFMSICGIWQTMLRKLTTSSFWQPYNFYLAIFRNTRVGCFAILVLKYVVQRTTVINDRCRLTKKNIWCGSHTTFSYLTLQ